MSPAFLIPFAYTYLFILMSWALQLQGSHEGQDLVPEAIRQLEEMVKQVQFLYEGRTLVSKDDMIGPLMKSHYCKCKSQLCQCCEIIQFKPFGLNDQIWVSAQYIPAEFAVAANISWDGKVIISEKLSLRNPPDLCADVPIEKLHKLLELCLKMYNIDISGGQVKICFEVKLSALFMPIFTIHFGCAHFGTEQNNWICSYSHENSSIPIDTRHSCVGTCDGVLQYGNISSLVTANESFDTEENFKMGDSEARNEENGDTGVKNVEKTVRRYFKGQCEFMSYSSDPENLCVLGCVPTSYDVKVLLNKP